MKECWVTEPLHFEMRETEIPEPKDNEVQIKMMAAGVCGSDIHIYKGENPNSRYPLIPGHENVGLVTKVGADCKNIKVGDHVVVDYVIRCGECYQCKHGRGNVCEHVLVRGSGTNGGWREYWCVEEPYVYKIDDSISWKDAALIEPLTIGEHSTSRAGVCEDDVVFILGTGTIGTIIAQACKLKGAKTVICCDISDSSLERSKQFGADYTVNSKTQDIVAEVQKITNGHGCTVAFDSACFPGSLTMIMQPGIVCNAGRVVPMGFCTVPEKITQQMINGRELTICGTLLRHQRQQSGAQQAVRCRLHREQQNAGHRCRSAEDHQRPRLHRRIRLRLLPRQPDHDHAARHRVQRRPRGPHGLLHRARKDHPADDQWPRADHLRHPHEPEPVDPHCTEDGRGQVPHGRSCNHLRQVQRDRKGLQQHRSSRSGCQEDRYPVRRRRGLTLWP